MSGIQVLGSTVFFGSCVVGVVVSSIIAREYSLRLSQYIYPLNGKDGPVDFFGDSSFRSISEKEYEKYSCVRKIVNFVLMFLTGALIGGMIGGCVIFSAGCMTNTPEILQVGAIFFAAVMGGCAGILDDPFGKAWIAPLNQRMEAWIEDLCLLFNRKNKGGVV